MKRHSQHGVICQEVQQNTQNKFSILCDLTLLWLSSYFKAEDPLHYNKQCFKIN